MQLATVNLVDQGQNQCCSKIRDRSQTLARARRRCGDRVGPFRSSAEAKTRFSSPPNPTPHLLVMFKNTARLFKPTAVRNFTPTTPRYFHFTSANMGVTKQKLHDGDGKTYAKQGDTITMEYTGTLFDESAPNKKGKQYVRHCVETVSADWLTWLQVRLFRWSRRLRHQDRCRPGHQG